MNPRKAVSRAGRIYHSSAKSGYLNFTASPIQKIRTLFSPFDDQFFAPNFKKAFAAFAGWV